MAEVAVNLQDHPIMLTLRDAISGDGFLGGITLTGRALMRKEEDGKWWMYGVRPAGLVASGDTVEATFLNFRNAYKQILFDIAQEAKGNFGTFKNEVETFFYEPDADNEDERLWEAALTAVRNECIAPPEPFAKLPRESPETKPSGIAVMRLDDENSSFMPSDNGTDVYSIARLPQAA
jgi:predicted RNase H-like HicB family nuclease